MATHFSLGRRAALLAMLASPLWPGFASAQLGDDPALHHGSHRQHREQPGPQAPSDTPKPTPKPAPRQRLDAGAFLCSTEEALQQHEAAIAARLDGRAATEPPGCRLVQKITPVSVVERHGPARTQVRLPGPPEQTGWTDAVVRDQ